MNSYCPAALIFTPALLEAAFSRIPQDKWDTPTGADRFSPREVIHHMTFWEPVARWRVVPDWDEDQHAKELNYSTLDPIEALKTFAEERAKTAALYDTLQGDQWDRTFVHPVKGRMTAYAWAATMLGHDLYHLSQLEDASK
jgi:hypothetical protein